MLSTIPYSFVTMEHTHHGNILQSAMKTAGISASELARRMKMARKTLYNRFESEKIDFYELVRFGKVLDYDFSKDVPEIDMYRNDLNSLVEGATEYGNRKTQELEDCRKSLGQYRDEAYKLSKELNAWKDKYIQLVEEMSALKLQLKSQ